MNESLLATEKDPMGHAIKDYYENHRDKGLIVSSSQFEDDTIPVKQLFRTYSRMPLLERKALELASGEILDVGAGSGCHALALQRMGKTVCAIDISTLSVEVMKQRGVREVYAVNLFDERFEQKFDTILLLMNGSGLIGRLENMPLFFQRMKQLLRPGGSVLLDSSDLCYLYEDDEGGYEIDLDGEYYGLVDFRMRYDDVEGDRFDWLYIDFDTLAYYAELHGFAAEKVCEGKHFDYLARLMPVADK